MYASEIPGAIHSLRFPYAVTARYWRMNGIARAGGWGHSLWEFELYGDSSKVEDIGKFKGLRAMYGSYIFDPKIERVVDHGGVHVIYQPFSPCFYEGVPGLWAGVYNVDDIFDADITGYIYAPIDGEQEYTFSLMTDIGRFEDGNLTVNGELQSDPGQTVKLEGGKWYPIEIKYKSSGVNNRLELMWNVKENENCFRIW
jgi:hypothetical protein